MINLIYFLLFTILVIYSYKEKNLINPIFILFIPMLFSYVGYNIYYKSLTYNIRFHFYIVILLVLFFLGFFLGVFFFKKIKINQNIYLEELEKIEKLDYLFKILVMIFFIFMLINLKVFYINSDMLTNFHKARHIEGREYLGERFKIVVHTLSLMYFYFNSNKRYTYFVFILLVLMSLIRVERINILFTMMTYLVIYILREKEYFKRITFKKIFLKVLIQTVIFLTIYTIFAILTNKVKGNLVENIVFYFSYSLKVFENNIFERYENLLGIGAILPEKISNYIVVEPENLTEIYYEVREGYIGAVSGAFGSLYITSGKITSYFFYFFLGIFYSFFYSKRNKSIYSSIFYSIIIFPLLMNFFDNIYIYNTYFYYYIFLKITKIFINTMTNKKCTREGAKCMEELNKC